LVPITHTQLHCHFTTNRCKSFVNNSLQYNFSSLQYNCRSNAITGGPLGTSLVPITHTQLHDGFTTNCCKSFTSTSLQYKFSPLQYNFSSIAQTESPAQQFTTVNRYICSECHFRENRLKVSQWLNIHKRSTGSISVYASQ